MSAKPVFVYIEDDDSSREVMRMLLTYRLGYSTVTIFEDTSDFLNKLDKLSPRPTVFFLDIHVKPYSGFEILKMLRKHEHYAKTTVVAVTASVMNEEVEALQSAGFDSVIAKPIDPDAFPDLVKAILNGEKVWQISS
jgi:CheY-like chemotaxis protein